MITKAYKVYGFDGHRQKESFNPSKFFVTNTGAMIDVYNADLTGTNEYSLVEITAEDPEAEINGQVSDGIFENYRTGPVVEVGYAAIVLRED